MTSPRASKSRTPKVASLKASIKTARNARKSRRKAHAQDLRDHVRELCDRRRQVLNELGRCLKEIREDTLYDELGYSTFESFVDDVCDFGVSTALGYIRIHDNLGDIWKEHNLDQLPITALRTLASANLKPGQRAVWAKRAQEMPVYLLAEKIRPISEANATESTAKRTNIFRRRSWTVNLSKKEYERANKVVEEAKTRGIGTTKTSVFMAMVSSLSAAMANSKKKS